MFIIINGNNGLLNRKLKMLKFPTYMYIQYKQNITPFFSLSGARSLLGSFGVFTLLGLMFASGAVHVLMFIRQ